MVSSRAFEKLDPRVSHGVNLAGGLRTPAVTGLATSITDFCRLIDRQWTISTRPVYLIRTITTSPFNSGNVHVARSIPGSSIVNLNIVDPVAGSLPLVLWTLLFEPDERFNLSES